MKKNLGIVAFVAASAMLQQSGSAQQTAPASTHPTKHRSKPVKKATPNFEEQLELVRSQLQTEIDDLKARLSAKDAQLDALQTANQSSQQSATVTAAKVEKLDTTQQQTISAETILSTSVVQLETKTADTATAVQQVKQSQQALATSIAEPPAIHYKGVTITPGGFAAFETIWRQRALNADIYTNFNATPYPNADEAHTSEWVPSARPSRFSALVTGKVPFGTLSGYVETDFEGAGSTSNNLQSNSYALRPRQAWAQVTAGHVKLTGGQMWTLLTENKKAADPNTEAVPLLFDVNLHVGDTYLRQAAFRAAYAISPKVTIAASLENSQYQFSASNAPANFFFGAPGAAGGLNNPSANYTNQVSPDVIAKVSFDPGYGHYEIGGVARFFRDRYYPATTTSVGAQNDTRLGGGFVANARFPVTKKLDLGFHLVAGDGTGRYGPALLPDITVRPNGTLAPLRNAQGLFSLELHPTKKLDLVGYAGTEYVQRTYYRNTAGVLVGYAPPTAVNSGCSTEVVPTAGTGYAPGTSATCLGATRVITEGSAGWIYRLYSGPAGRLQFGAAYSYLTREAWTGVGGAPKATNNMVYTSFRYYVP